MGEQYLAHCPVCGYETAFSIGVGFAYPSVFVNVQDSAKSGKLGVTLKKFLVAHPDGAVNPECVLARCEKCGEYQTVPDLTMHIPSKGKHPKKKPQNGWLNRLSNERVGKYGDDSFNNEGYFSPIDLKEQFEVYKLYPHRCHKCRCKLKIIPQTEFDKLKCPHCEEQILVVKHTAFWD